jgi:hypothetical protein
MGDGQQSIGAIFSGLPGFRAAEARLLRWYTGRRATQWKG